MYLTVTAATPFLAWSVGAPLPGPDCVQLLAGAAMATRDCAATNDYLCEYDGIAPVPSAY